MTGFVAQRFYKYMILKVLIIFDPKLNLFKSDAYIFMQQSPGKLIKTSSEWKNYTLDQVGVWAIGSGFPKNAQGQQNEEILFCKVSDMNLLGNEKYINDTNHSISLATAKQLKTKVHNVGTVIFPKIGGAIATNKRSILTKPTAIDNNCLGISPHNFVDSEWLYLLLKNIDFSEYQAGTSVPALQQAKIAKIKVYVPSLEDQHKVINEVKNYRRLCDQLEQQQTLSSEAHATLVDTLLKALTESSDADEFQDNWQRMVVNFDVLFTTEYSIEQLKQTVLQLAVMGKLVKQDPSDEPASELLKKIVDEKAKLIKEGKIKKSKPLPEIAEDEKPFELPEDACWVRLEELIPSFQNGNSSRGDKDGVEIAVLRLADITNNRIDLSDLRYLVIDENSIARYQLIKNDILITRVNGSTDIVGSFTYCADDIKAIYCDHFIRMRLNQLWIDSEYLSTIGRSRLIRSQIESLFITTAGQKTVNQKHIGSILVPLFTKNQQIKIVQKVNQLFSMIEQLQVLQSKLQKTKLHLADALVANAVEGV
ncbi:restriction endonuclease subunit S [Acinetobacter indicus]|uniref:restriction endonuclease subunit S n=1 Tax=Acinetobacter indicus TaxID=756892 RepID=UPI0032B45DE7